MTWHELSDFCASLSAADLKRTVKVCPDAALDPDDRPKMPPVVVLTCCMPAVGGYDEPWLMVSDPGE